MLRPIIEIDEDKCNGCGQCITDCAEGALAIVDGKARLISEVYCDGLGACLNCPQGALSLGMRDAPEFDEEAAMKAKEQREKKKAAQLKPLIPNSGQKKDIKSQLPSWPIQLALVPPTAVYLKGAPILLGAHCAGFAAPNIKDWLTGRIPLIACPKLENQQMLIDRLASILSNNETPEISILRMSVPCCGLDRIVSEAIKKSGSKAKVSSHIVNLS